MKLKLIFYLLIASMPCSLMADTVNVINVQSDTAIVNSTKTIKNQSKDTAKFEAIEKPDSIINFRVQGTELWVFIACCLTFVLAGINRRINEKKHDQTILGFLNFNTLGQSVNRSFYEFNIHQLIGLIVHNLVLSFWCFYFFKETSFQIISNNLLFFVFLFFSVSLVYICKFFFQYLALNIIQTNELSVLVVKCIISLGYFFTLITLPLFMVMYYIQNPDWQLNLEYILLCITAVYLLFRTFKIFQLFAQFFGISFFYNILYFCGLELIPLLVLIKLIIRLF
ncbi:MAG: DUF4271 domain-containing protein [Bacteroidetes bacterium]|nr:DUF4271 domain-containing protein [Bacteroidota bacterium]